MARGDTQVASGARRLKPNAARIAAKVAGLQARVVAPWVQPLNPGFFLIERARMQKAAKQKRLRG